MDKYEQVIEDLDSDFVQEFIENIVHETDYIQQNLAHLSMVKDKGPRYREILTSINNIESYCRQAFLDPLVTYLQTTCRLIERAANNEVPETELLSELISLVFDELVNSSYDIEQRRSIDIETIINNENRLQILLTTKGEAFNSAVRQLLPCFIRRINAETVESAYKEDLITHDIESNAEVTPPNKENISCFENIAELLDSKNSYWQGRTKSILQTAYLINANLGNVVDNVQLSVAVFMHDLGMALIPDSILFKEGKYEDHEVMLLKEHPIVAYELIAQMENWQSAAQMVHQHHERYDGLGYPLGLKEKNICAGAYIIAIADTYYSLTHNRSDRFFKRSTLRALSEINRNAGTQFDPATVEAFNRVMSDNL